ncbi:hypothetical protein GVN21_12840 [Caulobacter sp. SLTY]|uniref:hypothetical protein n=1 Tax=Caulobacter sp. SLTY TaxID=2683262 RepID=UPI00141201C7|nr:hypothetical protein [Caulobacter sp. SLTY]NBB16246.1 hypothetical protein [Caulobacter sp. SLTY]
MTVEVLLMNRTAVAMAADSAVSVTEDSRVLTSQTGVQKVFVLNGQSASGLMVHGLAEFCGCPWATVVEAFKAKGLGGEPTLAATVESIVGLLRSLYGGELVSREQAATYFRFFVAYAVRDFQLHYERLQAAAPGRPRDELLGLALEHLRAEVMETTVYEDTGPRQVERGRVGEETQVLRALIAENLDHVLELMADDLLGKGVVSREMRAKLAGVVRAGLTTTWMPSELPTTGVVIAGFGRDEISPSYFELQVYGLLGDVLKYDYSDAGRLGPDLPVVIKSFAQDSAVNRFLRGADWVFLANTDYASAHLATEMFQGMFEGNMDAGQRKALTGQMTGLVSEAVRFGLYQAMRARFTYVLDTYGSKVRSATSAEPLGRLAGQLLTLPIVESELTGNLTVARPFSILRLSKGGASLSLEKELI